MKQPGGKQSVVGKHPHHHKESKAEHEKRHLAAEKAAHTRKHNLATGKTHKHPRKHHHHLKRGLALGAGVACCAAEALAVSLRLAGQPVTDADVLDLYWRTASDPDEGAPILATLEAASLFTLAGYRPVFEEVMPSAPGLLQHLRRQPQPGLRVSGAGQQSLILGLDLPGPHTVLATPDGWWSWGELHCPCEWPDAVLEEAWLVRWSLCRPAFMNASAVIQVAPAESMFRVSDRQKREPGSAPVQRRAARIILATARADGAPSGASVLTIPATGLFMCG